MVIQLYVQFYKYLQYYTRSHWAKWNQEAGGKTLSTPFLSNRTMVFLLEISLQVKTIFIQEKYTLILLLNITKRKVNHLYGPIILY